MTPENPITGSAYNTATMYERDVHGRPADDRPVIVSLADPPTMVSASLALDGLDAAGLYRLLLWAHYGWHHGTERMLRAQDEMEGM